MPGIIDFHTHAFPDTLAEKAMGVLLKSSGDAPAYHDGTIAGLVASMDRAGIRTAVLASIATRPGQSSSILEWSRSVRSERIVPLGSIHPLAPDPAAEAEAVAAAGLPGIKLHPMYQEFEFDDRRLYPLYEELSSRGLVLLTHAGYDIAFGGNRQASPEKILKVHRDFPDLKLVAAHLGGWRLWEEVLEFLAGEDIYLETSMALGEGDPGVLAAIIGRHDPGRLLFGSDSPWGDQSREVETWNNYPLPEAARAALFSGNAARLLGRNGT
ncbi:MAG TPA: amidohydrolase family protein [bacterium]|nr:amidohydrolase family protein [bacterium]HPJ71059.1 amidohydrolase family protein [bacterium]HPQ65924.1 amidohydrolase family protein [bacterium]